jgi:hypothetical protein
MCAPLLGRNFDVRRLWRQPDAIAVRDLPEPVLVEIDLAHVFRDGACRSVEQRVAKFGIVMPGVIGNTVGADRVSEERRRPSLATSYGKPLCVISAVAPSWARPGPASRISVSFLLATTRT